MQAISPNAVYFLVVIGWHHIADKSQSLNRRLCLLFWHAVMEVTIVKSQKGHDLVGYLGFQYRLQSVYAAGIRRWRCSKNGCRGRLSTVTAEDDPQVLNGHDHLPVPEAVTVSAIYIDG